MTRQCGRLYGCKPAAAVTVSTLAPPPSAYLVALEFPGTSPNFHYSNPLWTNTALRNSAVSGGTERKTSAFFTATSIVKLEIVRPGLPLCTAYCGCSSPRVAAVVTAWVAIHAAGTMIA